MYASNLAKEGNLSNGIIDVLNRTSTADMAVISEHYGLADLTFEGARILSGAGQKGLLDIYNNFIGLNRKISWIIIFSSFPI